MFLPTLCLGLLRVRLARDVGGDLNRANVNRREGIIISNVAASIMAIYRLALNLIFQGIRGRVRLIINGRLCRVVLYQDVLIKPVGHGDERAVFVRRAYHPLDYVGLGTLEDRSATKFRRVRL